MPNAQGASLLNQADMHRQTTASVASAVKQVELSENGIYLR